MKNPCILGFVLVLTSLHALYGVPSQVVILRHGEKEKGMYSSLAPQGQQRAAKLVDVFAGSTLPSFLNAKPDYIFGTTPHTLFTIGPTAQALSMSVNVYLGLTDSEIATATNLVVSDILNNPLYANKTLIVCWEHHNIPNLAAGLGATNAPTKWHGKVFDRYWVLTFNPTTSNSAASVSFSDLPQNLLPGDSKS